MARRRNEELREWTRKVIEKMPHLTKSQAVVLGMWSFGIVMTQSCGLSTVAAFIAAIAPSAVPKAIVGKKENTVRQSILDFRF
jgi:diaminopimelate epimerase